MKNSILTLSLTLICAIAFAQGEPEIKSDGIVFPSLTTIERNGISPSNGQVIYNSTDQKLQWWNVGWQNLGFQDFIIDDDLDTKILARESGAFDRIELITEGTNRAYFIGNDNDHTRWEFFDRGDNISIGDDAGANLNALDGNNVIIGEFAGKSITTGKESVYVGSHSGETIDPAAQSNVGIGYNALISAQSFNTAIGAGAGSTGNPSGCVFIGNGAGLNASDLTNALYISNEGGNDPLIFGEFDNRYVRFDADVHVTGKVLLENDQSVAFKTADGLSEKGVLATGVDDHTSINATNDIIFNSGGTTAASFRAMTIKSDRKVGIGTTLPLWKTVIKETENAITGTRLAVDISNLAAVFAKESNTNNEAVGIGFQSSSDEENVGAAIIHERVGGSSQGSLHFATKGTTGVGDDIPIRMTIRESGNVGIGINNPQHLLDVAGTTRSIDILCGATLLCSDVRYKKDFKEIGQALALVQELNGFYHHWRTEDFPTWKFPEKQVIGFKAQEVQQVLPEVVHTMEDGYLAVDYAKVVPVLVEAIKEQQRIIEKLQFMVESNTEAYLQLCSKLGLNSPVLPETR